MPEFRDARFEWNTTKSSDTFVARGFDFHFASQLFEGGYIESEDRTHSDDEIRFKAIGPILGAFFAVIYTERGPRKRIISARKAEKYEIDDYAKEFGFEY